MEAVLYICHGSRLQAARDEAIAFVERCKSLRSEPIQEYGYLELAVPTISQAISQCIAKGATKIRAIPVLLLTAAHAKIDIPEELGKVLEQFPSIKLEFGKPIGVHPYLLEVLVKRIEQTSKTITEKSKVLLVGRGSSDLDVKRDLTTIANLLGGKIKHPVEPCFLTGCSPLFSEMMENLKYNSEVNQVFIVPYFLFTGLLMKGIERTIKQCTEGNSAEFILCHYLGDCSEVAEALNERIDEIELSKPKPQPFI